MIICILIGGICILENNKPHIGESGTTTVVGICILENNKPHIGESGTTTVTTALRFLMLIKYIYKSLCD